MSAADPLVSVVVPTFDRTEFLAQALRSVAAQTYNEWEVVVVDDGSPDPDAVDAVVASAVNARVIHQSNGGLPVARNAGLAASRGEFIAFLDDDDVWAPDKLHKQLAALQKSPDALGCYCSGWYLAEDSSRLGQWETPLSGREQQLSGRSPLFRVVPALVRRTALELYGGFDPLLPTAEDNELALRLLQFGSFIGIRDSLYGIRRHARNKTIQDSRRNANVHVAVLREHLALAVARGDMDTAVLLRENLARSARASQRVRLRRLGGSARGIATRSIRRLTPPRRS